MRKPHPKRHPRHTEALMGRAPQAEFLGRNASGCGCGDEARQEDTAKRLRRNLDRRSNTLNAPYPN